MSLLRLVPPEGQPPKPPRPKYRRTEPHLTREEQNRVKIVLHHLRHRWGSWERLAEIMGNVNPTTLCKVAAPKRVVAPRGALRQRWTAAEDVLVPGRDGRGEHGGGDKGGNSRGEAPQDPRDLDRNPWPGCPLATPPCPLAGRTV